MRMIRWNAAKNDWLKQHRGICFEDVVILLEQDQTLDVIAHPNQERYPGQKIAIIAINDYACLVPYVEDGEEIFLKTIIPSRKATATYLEKRK